MASPLTPSRPLLPQPWLLPASQPGCPVSHHDQAQRPEQPLLQSPQDLGIPAFPSGILPPLGVKTPLQAFPWRCPKHPRRNPQLPALRYLHLLGGKQVHAEGGVGVWAHAQRHPFQKESGAAVQGTSEEKRAIEPTLGREGPGPLAPSLAKQEVEWTSGETGPMPCSTQGEPAQKVPSTEACHGGDLGSGLKLRAEVGVGDTPCRIKTSPYPSSAPSACPLPWPGSNTFAWRVCFSDVYYFVACVTLPLPRLSPPLLRDPF